jgi:hypothetical protein
MSDITIAEIRWIMLLRQLSPEKRAAVYELIRSMLPAHTPSPPVSPCSAAPGLH